MSSGLLDVTGRVPRSKPRGNGEASQPRNVDLAAVGVSRKGERYAGGDLRKDVWVMGENEKRCVVSCRRNRRLDLGVAHPQVGDSDDPQGNPPRVEFKRVILTRHEF